MTTATDDLEKAAPPMQEVTLEQPMPADAAKPEKPRGMSRRLRIALVVASLALIGLIVGLSVALTGSNDSSESASSVEGTPNTPETPDTPDTPDTPEVTDNVTDSVDLSHSKEYVDFICSIDSIKDADGLNLCSEVCEDAACCDPNGSADSCLEKDLEACVNYAKCHVFWNNDFEPAPTTLADWCSLESLAESTTNCEDACSAVKCCYSNEESCVASKFLTCLDYAPCQNLRESTDIVPAAPPRLQEACALDRQDDTECEQLCEAAECCTNDILQPEGDFCLQDNFISCLTYAPCGGLLIPAKQSQVNPAPDTLATACTLDNVLGSGREQCVEACSEAPCCTDLNPESNCFLEDPLGCIEYAQCALLHLTGGVVPRADENLKEKCSLESIEQDGAEACTQACSPASCCRLGFGADAEETCIDEGNYFTCAEYFPCTVLYIAGGGVEGPPPTIDDSCSSDAVMEDNGLACETDCSGGSCCFSLGDDNCLLGNAEVCISYLHSGCWRVDGWLSFDPSGPPF